MKIIKRVLDKEFQGKTPPTIPIPLSGSASRAPPVDKSFPIGPELMAIKVRMHYRARFFSEIRLQPSRGMLTGSRGTKQQKLKFRQSRRKAFESKISQELFQSLQSMKKTFESLHSTQCISNIHF